MMNAATMTTTPPPAPTTTRTVVDRFWERVRTQPDRPALRTYVDGEWRPVTWGNYGMRVDEVAAGLLDLGVEAGDRVGLLSGNRAEWHIADMAILSVGAVTVPIYPTSSSPQVAYVLRDSGARVCFVEGPEQLSKVLLHIEELPQLERLVGLVPLPGLDRDAVVIDVLQLRSEGRRLLAEEPDAVARRADRVASEDMATLVYTSGTTGPPKGAVLTHANLDWTASAVDAVVQLQPDERFLSYLPLSHIAERVTSHVGQIVSGGETWFARSLATVPDDLRACRPTIFFAVPRVWQKFHEAILEQIAAMPRPLRAVIERYIELGLSKVRAHDDGGRIELLRRAEYAALDRTIGAQLRRKLGLDRARIIVSAAAPIHPDLVRWFHALGLPIAEVWGQTEDCGPATVNPPDAIRIGTVGLPLPGLEVRTAEDGELQVRGGSVCAGYYRNPDATAKLLDDEGWLSTGDLGVVDDDGYVRITGRKKDLIINAAGKNISPSEIETRLSMESLIGQAVVVGDGRKYLVALLTLDPDAAAEWAERHGAFADIASLVNDPSLRADVAASVDLVNRQHAPVEQIKRWRILHEPFSVEGGELTATMKVKRATVIERHANVIEELYAERAH
jgi:long-chain acyl-CoA synthetase